jgi:hypothetical protein
MMRGEISDLATREWFLDLKSLCQYMIVFRVKTMLKFVKLENVRAKIRSV